MMRVTLSYQPSSSLTADLYPAASSASCRSRSGSGSKQLWACSIVCAIPARDVVIDFGKFKGSRMGTLPSTYLRWLIREASQSRLAATHSGLAVWGDYAKQVLRDPYYLDRLEWESIEKLTLRGDMRKSGPPTGNTSVKGSMQALGWDLSDRNGWSQVNFSLLGTSLGGRIPRRKLDPSVSSPEPAISNPKPSPTLASGMSTGKNSIAGRIILPSAAAANPAKKSSLLNAAADTQDPKVKPQPTHSLSLQEELLRRRQLRKERSSPKSSSTLRRATQNVRTLFPGRESLLKKAKERADQ